VPWIPKGWSARIALASTLAGPWMASCRAAAVRETAELRVEMADPGAAEEWLERALRIRAGVLTELGALAPDAPARVTDERSLRIIEVEARERWPDSIQGSADLEQRVIRLRPEAVDPEVALSHELVHLLLGPDWSTLPAALVEGLSDFVGASAIGALARFRADRGEGLTAGCGPLCVRLSWTLPGATATPLRASQVIEWRSGAAQPSVSGVAELLAAGRESFVTEGFDPARSPVLYAVAFVLVERIASRAGLAALHEACAQAKDAGLDRVPPARVLALAGMPSGTSDVDLETLCAWLSASWDGATQEAWLDRRALALAPAVARTIGWHGSGGDGRGPDASEALRELRVRIAVTPSGSAPESLTDLPLEDLPRLFAAVAASPQDL